MQQTSTPSLQDLKRETEQTRAGLTTTVEQLKTTMADTASELRHRISPDVIKAEVADYVRSRGERLMADITESARRNPIQAVAVGASFAYPLLRMARAIPLPVLMVGAGVFLARSETGRSATQKMSDMASDLTDTLQRRGHDLSEQVNSSLASAKDAATATARRAADMVSTGTDEFGSSASTTTARLASVTDRAREGAGSLRASVKEQAGDLKDGMTSLASSATDATRGFAGQALNSAREVAASAKDVAASAKDVAASARDTALETARDLRDRASQLSDRAGRTALDTIQQNPLLVAGVGLLIGGLIASALPRSGIEESVVGETAAAAKRRAQQAASQGFEAAKGAATEIIENVARQARAEGLDPDALDASAKDVGQRLKRVAETAVTTAFNPDGESPSNAGGEHNHG